MASPPQYGPIIQGCLSCGSPFGIDDNALLCCNRCKHARYCGKDYQAKHWPFHRTQCKTLAGFLQLRGSLPVIPQPFALPAHISSLTIPFQAFIIEMRPGPPDQTHDVELKPSMLKLESSADWAAWEELPITTVLGFPLSLAMVPTAGPRIPNLYHNYFTMDPDPKSPDFGQPGISQPTNEALVLTRRDGKYMTTPQMEALIFYLRFGLAAIRAVKGREEAGEVVDREQLARGFLTPTSFGVLFEEMRRLAVGPGKTEWEGAEIPVLVSQG